jgi:branched-chain amino acid transport system ATP-binding protein
MLKVRDLCFDYGKIPIIGNLSFDVEEGGVTCIVGSNGTGKTTALLTISCNNKAKSGTIEFYGERIEHLAAHEVASRGLILVPEGRELFPSLTVLENLEMGCAINPRTRKRKSESLEHVFMLFPRLKDRMKQLAGSLSGGEQQMLAIGRGLMACPRLLLMDEPSLGLSPIIVKEVFRMIKEISSHDVTILLVEQNALKSLAISKQAYIMGNGTISFHGAGKELLQDRRVKMAYLGTAQI